MDTILGTPRQAWRLESLQTLTYKHNRYTSNDETEDLRKGLDESFAEKFQDDIGELKHDAADDNIENKGGEEVVVFIDVPYNYRCRQYGWSGKKGNTKGDNAKHIVCYLRFGGAAYNLLNRRYEDDDTAGYEEIVHGYTEVHHDLITNDNKDQGCQK